MRDGAHTNTCLISNGIRVRYDGAVSTWASASLLLLGVFWFLRLGGDQLQRPGDLRRGGWHDVSDRVVTGLVSVVFDLDRGTVIADVSVRTLDDLGSIFGTGVLHVSGGLGDDTVLGLVSKTRTSQ